MKIAMKSILGVRWTGKYEEVYTFNGLNWFAFFLGMFLVYLSPHNWLTFLGAWIASFHFVANKKHIERSTSDDKEGLG